MSGNVIKQQIENLLQFLEPLLGFANCHMVDFFTHSSYVNFVPLEIQKEVDNLGKDNVVRSIFENNFNGAPILGQYVANSLKFTLKNIEFCLDLDSFTQKLIKWGCNANRIKLEIFMSAKKSHEVEILSAAASSISKIAQISHMIDIGDGKGYLSSMLALHHEIPVLGIDASNVNTCGAIKRVNKLAKIWKGISENPNRSHPKKIENLSSNNVSLYKQVTEHVDENFELQKLIGRIFGTTAISLRLGLVGLHTCGDLASDSMKIFISNDDVKSICNVGCCYHLLTEKFEKKGNFGFPLSQFLKSRNLTVGRSARMIANQSVERILQSKELPNITIYYRALLQIILEQYCPEMPTKHVGKFRKLPQNFTEYVRIATKRIDAKITLSDDEIGDFFKKFEGRIAELNLFYLLRSKLSPVIESLILLDRLLFLKENNFENSFIVQLFDPIVSPRCYGIVAIKDFL